jgi:hypothetical protein
MKKYLSNFGHWLLNIKWLPYALSAAGGLLYIFWAIAKARSLSTYIDEGMYLYKGFLFLTHQYTPYQGYGVWTNKPPLAFLIPGTVQYLFGPGLGVGRYFSVALSVFTILGLWLIAKRFSGPWAGAIIVWAFTLNPAEIKNLTLAITQGEVAFFIVWTLVCILGEKRKLWHFLLAGLLGGLAIMTRLEIFPFFILAVLYLWWQHGWKSAAWAAIGIVIPVVALSAVYWPGILSLLTFLPKSLTPFLDQFRITAKSLGSEPTSFSLYLMYFWLVIRLHPISFLGALSVFLLWPSHSNWKSPFYYKMAIFLTIAFVGFWVEYLLVAFGMDFCVSCVITYVVYFDYIGLLLLVIFFSSVQRKASLWRSIAIFFVMAVSIVFVLFSGAEDLKNFSQLMVSFPIPRMRNLHFLPGTAEFWRAIYNKFGLGLDFFYTVVPIAIGVLVAVILILLVKRWTRNLRNPAISSAYLMICTVLVLAFVLSPTMVLAGGNNYFACKNVLSSFGRVGKELQTMVKPGQKVYWEGRSVAIFLYLPQVNLYPPQLNQNHSFRIGSDSESLLRNGFWNQELAVQWLEDADIILIEKPYLRDWEEQILYYSGKYREVFQTSFLGGCDGSTRIVVIEKK